MVYTRNIKVQVLKFKFLAKFSYKIYLFSKVGQGHIFKKPGTTWYTQVKYQGYRFGSLKAMTNGKVCFY